MTAILLAPAAGFDPATHWLGWFAARLPGSHLIVATAADRAMRLQESARQMRGGVWIVAHGEACQDAVSSARAARDRIAGLMLVAPVAPVADELAADETRIGVPGALVASGNDPGLRLTHAGYLASRWGLALLSLGNAGHIDPAAGYGPWHQGLEILARLRAAHERLPGGEIALP